MRNFSIGDEPLDLLILFILNEHVLAKAASIFIKHLLRNGFVN